MIRGLAEIVERRPNDPIEYLATFLYKQVDNTRAQKQVKLVVELCSMNLNCFRDQREDDIKRMEIEQQQAEEEKQHRIQMRNEIRALREKEEAERKQREQEERRKREAEELARRYEQPSFSLTSTDEIFCSF